MLQNFVMPHKLLEVEICMNANYAQKSVTKLCNY
jgi:hypothetical protein